MAADPSLRARVIVLVTRDGRPAASAILAAAEEQAALIAAIPDETLAARADDVRSLGRRAARLATQRDQTPSSGEQARGQTPSGDAVLVATDLGPADVAELGPEVRAIALSAGSPTAHAAIVARSLGIPMVVGLGEDLLNIEAGTTMVVDGDAGVGCGNPTAARAATRRRAVGRARAVADRGLPAVTQDGRRVRVLANVVSPAEVAAALELGAEGAGLIRTELHFLDATGWPDEAAHRRALAPVLAALRGRPATVRVLDYGGDKTPPFLRGTGERGLALLLGAPEALEAQLRAALVAGRDTELRILLPMVADAAELAEAAAALDRAVAATGTRRPLLGAMVETPSAADAAVDLAAVADFLSIGTNDLTHETLGTGRFDAGGAAATHDPRVLRHIARCAAAAHGAGSFLEVCGEAASSPLTMPLLVGLGVDELSVGAARVGIARAWVRALREAEAHELATQALDARDAATVQALAEPFADALRLVERGEAAAQDVDGGGGVAALRA
jgi:phosphoenolpyruvate-protein kinase (PTS system EI component)